MIPNAIPRDAKLYEIGAETSELSASVTSPRPLQDQAELSPNPSAVDNACSCQSPHTVRQGSRGPACHLSSRSGAGPGEPSCIPE
jgi:hypothetical protein